MIDWFNLLFHTLWILGLAVILAAFSYHDWLAAKQGVKLRQALDRRSFQGPLLLGLILVGLGLTLLAEVWWERLLWLGFVALFAAQGRQLWKKWGDATR